MHRRVICKRGRHGKRSLVPSLRCDGHNLFVGNLSITLATGCGGGTAAGVSATSCGCG